MFHPPPQTEIINQIHYLSSQVVESKLVEAPLKDKTVLVIKHKVVCSLCVAVVCVSVKHPVLPLKVEDGALYKFVLLLLFLLFLFCLCKQHQIRYLPLEKEKLT